MRLNEGRRIVLRYDPGQFTFRNFATNANNSQLLELARQLNSFQEDEVDQVLLVQEFRYVF